MKNNLAHIIYYLLFFSIVFISNIFPQKDISGFFDVVGIANYPETDKSKFLINQFELDFSYSHISHFSVGTAVAFNNETENMELAMAFVHYSFNDGPGKHPRRIEGYDHSALLIGKFDMPFGLDYLSYASLDRPSVTQPLVIEKTIAGWNDIGIDYHLFKNNLKIDIWTVNGFSKGIGVGGNIHYKFFPFLELGFSHSADINNFKTVNDWLSGVDLLLNTKLFEIKSEFLWMKGIYEGTVDTVLNNELHHGGYFQLHTKLEYWISLPLSFTIRVGGWQCSGIIEEAQRRYSATLGYKLHNNLALRAEIVTNTFKNRATKTLGYLQMVVSF